MDEAGSSLRSLVAFTKNNAVMHKLEQAVKYGGEREVVQLLHYERQGKAGGRETTTGIKHIADVRANVLGRAVFFGYWVLQLEKSEGRKIAVPGLQSVAPALAEQPAQRVLAFVDSFGAGLPAKAKARLVGKMLIEANTLCPRMFESWTQRMEEDRPELGPALHVLRHEMKEGSIKDINRWEELACELGKMLAGLGVGAGRFGIGDSMKGAYHPVLSVPGLDTPTGFPAPPVGLSQRYGLHVDPSGQLWMHAADYSPPSGECGQDAAAGLQTRPVRAQSAARSVEPAGSRAAATRHDDAMSSEPHTSATQRLSEVRRQLQRAKGAKKEAELQLAAAQKEDAAMPQRIASLSADTTFRRLCDSACGGDERLAYHLWSACASASQTAATIAKSGVTCGLHIDDLDLGAVLNLILSTGLSPRGDIVLLRGSLLMVFLAFTDTCLAGAVPPQGDAAGPVWGHDRAGNILLLEPGTMDLAAVLPLAASTIKTPSTQARVTSLAAKGVCVIAFFKSGGWLAAQLSHYWHAVVSRRCGPCAPTNQASLAPPTTTHSVARTHPTPVYSPGRRHQWTRVISSMAMCGSRASPTRKEPRFAPVPPWSANGTRALSEVRTRWPSLSCAIPEVSHGARRPRQPRRLMSPVSGAPSALRARNR